MTRVLLLCVLCTIQRVNPKSQSSYDEHTCEQTSQARKDRRLSNPAQTPPATINHRLCASQDSNPPLNAPLASSFSGARKACLSTSCSTPQRQWSCLHLAHEGIFLARVAVQASRE